MLPESEHERCFVSFFIGARFLFLKSCLWKCASFPEALTCFSYFIHIRIVTRVSGIYNIFLNLENRIFLFSNKENYDSNQA
jgi:hypothetical protein